MNFFEHQDKARRQTTRLVLLLLVAVALVVLFTAIIASGVVTYFQTQTVVDTQWTDIGYWKALFTNPIFAWSALGTLTVIFLGSAYKSLQLGGNGIQVALSMNAKHVHPETDNPQHKQFFNIVTEMALASGSPVPKVFVIPGHGINAFAAGFNRHQTVVAATEGALEQLTRDELQGVVAHEFSHINFGDVKINMRLVALLHGILLIGLIGQHMVGGSRFGRRRHHSRSRSDNKSAGVGLALMAIGYAGTFCGNMIKAAVSRQREFLADASAVQFTRNPEGIANALKKIARGPDEISIESENAEQYSHFYFSSLRARFFSNLFSTHPDIDERISRLGHSFEAQPKNSPNGSNRHTQPSSDVADNAMGFAGSSGAHNASRTAQTMTSAQAGEALVNCVGQPSAQNLDAAKLHIKQLPSALIEASHSAFSARALIYGLIITNTPKDFHDAQHDYLTKNAHPATVKALAGLLPQIAKLSQGDCHNLLLMAESALQDQSKEQADVFKCCAKALIEADKQLTLFEWCIYRLAIAPFKAQLSGNIKLSDCAPALSILFYYAASHTEADQRLTLLKDVNAILGVPLPAPAAVSLKKLDGALTQLSQLKPLSKPALLKALVACIKSDGKITDDEIALLRMVALVLDCPIPDIAF